MKYLLKQFFEPESSTFTYFIIDRESNEAVIIDPVLETLERDVEYIKETGFKIKYILDTHVHADHITAAGKLREITGAKTVIGSGANVDCIDISINDHDSLKLGKLEIVAISTPGHTDSCTSYYVPQLNSVFTGDALLIRGNGRTDFQQGDASVLYDSIQKLFSLKEDTVVYPAHDYKGRNCTTIEEEKKYNPRIGNNKTKEEFIKIMDSLKLANPKKIQEALPANLACGNKTN